MEGIEINENGEIKIKIKGKRGPKKRTYASEDDKPPHMYRKGNKSGKRFGEGQPCDKGGRPKGTSAKVLLETMKAAAETYALSAEKVAKIMVDIALSQEVEVKYKFPFLKEINARVFGLPKNSMEDSIKYLTERVDKLYELTMPLLEATAIGDGVGIVRELIKQGKLDEVVSKVKEES